jgi:hypothetical protein
VLDVFFLVRHLICFLPQVTNPSVPKVSALSKWEQITWSVVLIFVPIGALNNVDSGAFVWLAGLGSFLYFCSINM